MIRTVPHAFVLLVLVLLFGAGPAGAQFAPCGTGVGVCTCADGVTVVTNAGQCPGALLNVPPLPRCGAGSVAAGPCVCSDGRLSGAGGTCAEHACPSGQIRVGDDCRCVQRGFVPNAAGVCGCPSGTAMVAGKDGPACVKR